MNNAQRHETFLKGLRASGPAVDKVIEYLSRLSWNVTKLAPDDYVENYVERGDVGIELDKTYMIQVKGEKKDFHNDDLYPYPRVFIDTVNHIYEMEYPYPLCAYALVNLSLTGMYWIPSTYKPKWYIIEKQYLKHVDYYTDMVAMHTDYLVGLYIDFKHDKISDDLIYGRVYPREMPQMQRPRSR